MKKIINERQITKNFINEITSFYSDHDNNLNHGNDGVVSPEELYNHFDLDNDGTVTTDEYVNHIEYHAANPETLDHYRRRESDSLNNVPCRDSYQSCSTYFLSDPEHVQSMMRPILNSTGATCYTSVAQSLLDVLKSMKDCGLI